MRRNTRSLALSVLTALFLGSAMLLILRPKPVAPVDELAQPPSPTPSEPPKSDDLETAASAEPGPTSGSVVGGRVTLKGSETGVGELALVVRGSGKSHVDEPEAAAMTDADGLFEIAGLDPGQYSLRLGEGATYALATGPVSFACSPDEEETWLDLAVVPGGSITGRIYDADTGRGISHHEVKLGGRGAVTDTDGSFRFDGLEEGKHRVHCPCPKGYPRSNQWRRSEEVYLGPGEMVEHVDIALSRGLSITGIVVDEAGEPVPDARVRGYGTADYHWSDWTTSEEHGSFELLGLEAGGHVVLSARTSESISAPTAALEIGEDGLRDVVITLLSGASIEGVVVDPQGVPVAGYTLRAEGRECAIGEKGEFRIAGLSAGVHDVTIQPARLRGRGAVGWVSLGHIEVQQAEEKTGLRLVYGEGLSISGRVLNADRTPVVDTTVHCSGPRSGGVQRNMRTDEDGFYRIVGLEEGEYRVGTWHGRRLIRYPEPVAAGSEHIDLILDALGGVEGRVVDALYRTPIQHFEIKCEDKVLEDVLSFHLDGSFTLCTSSEGAFTVTGYAPGWITVIVKAPGYTPGFKAVEVPAGEAARDVVIALEPATRTTGSVRDARGHPVANAHVYRGSFPILDPPRPDGALIATTDTRGAFVLDSLSPDTELITVHHPEYALAAIRGPFEGNLEVVLTEGGALEGTVTVGGKPVAAQSVELYMDNAWGPRNLWTDEAGHYSKAHLAPGQVKVAVALESPGGDNALRRRMLLRTEIHEGVTSRLDFPFSSASAVIEGTVFLDGKPVREGNIKLTTLSEGGQEESHLRLDRDGSFRKENVPAGTVEIEARGAGADGSKEYGEVRFEIGDGEHVRRDIHLGPAILEGRVVGLRRNESAGIHLVQPSQLEQFRAAGSVRAYLARTLNFGLRPRRHAHPVSGDGSFRIELREGGTYAVIAVAHPATSDGSRPDVELESARFAWAYAEIQGGLTTSLTLRLGR